MLDFRGNGSTGQTMSVWGRWGGLSVAVFYSLLLLGCASGYKPEASHPVMESHLASAHFLSPDGRVLPVRTFLPEHEPLRAMILAVHGFNDYSRAFSSVGPYFAARGIGLIAYDQQGFGLTGRTGLWAGSEQYAEDLRCMIRSVKKRYPDIPIFLLGESMGAAVVIAALEKSAQTGVEGVILSAPAVWSRDTMPWYQSLILDLAATTVPEVRLTGSGLRVRASDNIEMLRGLSRDPWVIKATRIDAIYGLADLMDTAQVGVDQIQVPTLLLYGGKDEIIPADPVRRVWIQIAGKPEVRAAYYPAGFHLLFRDLEASIPLGDVAGWILNRNAPLPSGCELQPHSPINGAEGFQGREGCLSGHAVSPNRAVDPR